VSRFHLLTIRIRYLNSASSLVGLILSYRGPQDTPINTAGLRAALDLYGRAEFMEIDWDATDASVSRENLPTLPPTLPQTSTKPKPSSHLRAVTLSLTDTKSHQLGSGKSSQPLISEHLSQLLPILVLPGLQKLELRMKFFSADTTVAGGFSSFGNSLRGMKCEGLTRLGMMSTHMVTTRAQVSESWVSHYDAYF
jgi:hypothetical protein